MNNNLEQINQIFNSGIVPQAEQINQIAQYTEQIAQNITDQIQQPMNIFQPSAAQQTQENNVPTEEQQHLMEPTQTVTPNIGTPPIPTTNNNSVSISVNENSIIENKTKLKEVASDIRTKWEVIKGITNEIRNSWVGKDAEIYTDKLNNMGPKLDKTIEALDLIANTYEKALQEINQTQNIVQKELL